MPLKGGSESILGVTVNYPAISAGTQQIRISFNGDREYSASQVEAEVVIQDRPQPEITLNEALPRSRTSGMNFMCSTTPTSLAVISSITSRI